MPTLIYRESCGVQCIRNVLNDIKWDLGFQLWKILLLWFSYEKEKIERFKRMHSVEIWRIVSRWKVSMKKKISIRNGRCLLYGLFSLMWHSDYRIGDVFFFTGKCNGYQDWCLTNRSLLLNVLLFSSSLKFVKQWLRLIIRKQGERATPVEVFTVDLKRRQVTINL